jgi:hypothetical protein
MQNETLFPVLDPTPPPADVLPLSRHAAAGRLGAKRVHELVRLGRQYEQDHGLTRGRQRRRQLIQLGRRYESEHGLAAPKTPRRRSHARVWADFLRSLSEVMRPAYRRELDALLAGPDRPVGAAA